MLIVPQRHLLSLACSGRGFDGLATAAQRRPDSSAISGINCLPHGDVWSGKAGKPLRLRFWRQRVIRFGEENTLVNRIRRGVARAGLADNFPRAVDTWLRDNSAIVVAHLMVLVFLEPLVASITNLSNIIFTQGEGEFHEN
jgi:hypothetical protein